MTSATFLWDEHITLDTGDTVFRAENGAPGEILKNPTKYEVTGQYDLTLKDVVVEDGGKYCCHLAGGVRSCAVLVVLGKMDYF